MEEFRWREESFFQIVVLVIRRDTQGELEVVSLKNPCPFFTDIGLMYGKNCYTIVTASAIGWCGGNEVTNMLYRRWLSDMKVNTQNKVNI